MFCILILFLIEREAQNALQDTDMLITILLKIASANVSGVMEVTNECYEIYKGYNPIHRNDC